MMVDSGKFNVWAHAALGKRKHQEDSFAVLTEAWFASRRSRPPMAGVGRSSGNRRTGGGLRGSRRR